MTEQPVTPAEDDDVETVHVLKIEHNNPDVGTIFVQNYDDIWHQMMCLFGDESDMELGDTVTITMVEMPKAEFDALEVPEIWR